MTASQKSDYISRVRQTTRAFLAARENIAALIEVNDQTAIASALVDGDFVGDNAGITPAEFLAAATTLATIATYLKAGSQPTPLSKLMKIA